MDNQSPQHPSIVDPPKEVTYVKPITHSMDNQSSQHPSIVDPKSDSKEVTCVECVGRGIGGDQMQEANCVCKNNVDITEVGGVKYDESVMADRVLDEEAMITAYQTRCAEQAAKEAMENEMIDEYFYSYDANPRRTCNCWSEFGTDEDGEVRHHHYEYDQMETDIYLSELARAESGLWD
jgi:hypothetical protein